MTHGRARLSVLLVAGLLALTPAAMAEPAPIPEDFEAPLSTVEVFTKWEAPLSTVERFLTNPEDSTQEDLEEALGAENETVTLSDRFLFDFNSAELRGSAAASLDTVAALLDDTEGPVEIIGHTDAMGTDAVNQPLSQERARAVADYLATKGIDADRFTVTGKGSSEPVADNTHSDGRDNPEGRAQNRRVEIHYAG